MFYKNDEFLFFLLLTLNLLLLLVERGLLKEFLLSFFYEKFSVFCIKYEDISFDFVFFFRDEDKLVFFYREDDV